MKLQGLSGDGILHSIQRDEDVEVAVELIEATLQKFAAVEQLHLV